MNTKNLTTRGKNNNQKINLEKVNSQNPIINTIFTADPSAHVWEDGRIYIYASHDIDPAQGCDLMDKYHVYSSADLINWQDEGEILCADDISWGRPEGGFMWAPDCAYKDGIYYFYYPHPSSSKWNDSWKIGVATSKNAAADFKDQGYMKGIGGFGMIDPCVLVDDDRVYFYYGGGGRFSGRLSGCWGGELAGDMVSFKSELIKMKGLRNFHEATWVFKREDYYYLIYSDNKQPENCYRYAMSHHPLGSWKYKGVFLEPVGCETTHGSVVEFKGQWYLFYHNQAISGQGNLRSVCIDYLFFNPDGTIQTVVQTKEGVKPAGKLSITNHPLYNYGVKKCIVENGARKIAISRTDNKFVIQGLEQIGAYCEFRDLEGGNGSRAELSLHYATADDLVKLRLHINGKDHSLINVVSTGSWEIFSGRAFITVQFSEGNKNTVRFTGGFGKVILHSLSVKLLDM